MTSLAFGLNAAVPEGAETAWGARVIVDATGYVDFVPGRTDFFGDASFLDTLVAKFPTSMLRATLSDKLTSGVINTRVAAMVELFADDDVTVIGNSNGSCGYVYLAAFPTPKETS